MAVAITAPGSQVASRSSGIRIAWEPEYPQSAYEILYRRKGEQTWNTCGRVTGSVHQAELDPERFEDFTEYHYRVVCYSDDAASGTTIYSGSDSSAAYSLIVVPENRLATAKFRYGEGMLEVPVYTDEAVEGGIKVELDAGKRGEIPVGETGNALASGLRVSTGGGVKAVLGGTAVFQDSGVPAGAYMAVKSRYQYSYTNPVYYTSYRYSATNPVYYSSYKYSGTTAVYYTSTRYSAATSVYYYSYRYSWTDPTYYYSYKYSSTSATYYYKYAYSYTTAVTYYKYSYSYTTPVTYYRYLYSYTTPTTYGTYTYAIMRDPGYTVYGSGYRQVDYYYNHGAYYGDVSA